jgi:CheY-like chemotaxis protein
MEIEKIPIALVVDDNPLIIMFVSEIIEEAGFSVLTARSGEEAINTLEVQGSSTTLLFSDVKMPGAIDGVMLAHVVSKRWPHINIILSSGHSRYEFQDISENASFLEKPFTRNSLISLLSREIP